ncbi:MAG: hypothetical protein WBE80_08210 [Methylocella sp.]
MPETVTETVRRQAIDDAGRFLDRWGKLAATFGWTPGDLFDVPSGGACGLAWWLKGRTVIALGPEHAACGDPAYDRVARRDWVHPYTRPVRPVSIAPILEHVAQVRKRVLGRRRKSTQEGTFLVWAALPRPVALLRAPTHRRNATWRVPDR